MQEDYMFTWCFLAHCTIHDCTFGLALWFCLHRLPAAPNGDTVSTSEQRAATHTPYRKQEKRNKGGGRGSGGSMMTDVYVALAMHMPVNPALYPALLRRSTLHVIWRAAGDALCLASSFMNQLCPIIYVLKRILMGLYTNSLLSLHIWTHLCLTMTRLIRRDLTQPLQLRISTSARALRRHHQHRHRSA